ncbi:MAG: hypothetical protein LAO03_22335 [Acidobacteriia bacterium]|nr:hypothetical protein [Terriglobia bacterium]
MKRLGALTCVAVTLFAALAITVPLAAQEQPQNANKTHYTVQDLGTFGGTLSWAYGINNKGSVTGFATLPGDTEKHGFLWRKGRMTDLGILGGPNSSPFYKPNERDEVVGGAETSGADPSGEDYCGFGTYLTCLPFLWRHGVMTPLPTLGGNNGIAAFINNRGQVVGNAENTTPDSCGLHNFQTKPVLWQHGQIEELPLLPGDTNGIAQGINDRGQVAGFSGCNPFSLSSAVLWEKGTVTPLDSLGGNASGGTGINNRGQVFGYSYLADNVTYHGVLWQEGAGMQDLGTLPGDAYSDAWAIDEKGRVVGTSCDASFNCRAFLWQDGSMTDLNALIPADSPWFLWEADGINPRGVIVGLAVNMTTGEFHAFLATPTQSGSLAMQRNNVARPTLVQPENVRKLLQQRQGSRFGVGLTRPR